MCNKSSSRFQPIAEINTSAAYNYDNASRLPSGGVLYQFDSTESTESTLDTGQE